MNRRPASSSPAAESIFGPAASTGPAVVKGSSVAVVVCAAVSVVCAAVANVSVVAVIFLVEAAICPAAAVICRA